MRARVEDLCAGYEEAEEMVNMYMSNPQVLQQLEPMVVEQQAIDWIIENGNTKVKEDRLQGVHEQACFVRHLGDQDIRWNATL